MTINARIAVSVLAVSIATGAFAQESNWAPGDFGSAEDGWANSPHLQRMLESPTGGWAELDEMGHLEEFPASESLSQDIPRTEDGLPDIFGEWDFEWTRVGPRQEDDNRHLSAEEGHRLLPTDFASEEQYGIWQTRSLEESPTNNCVPHHGPRMALRTSRLEIVRSDPSAMLDKVIFLHQQFNVIRRAYMESNDFQPEPSLASRPVWGTSYGDWIDRSGDGEVDTFVMETRGVTGSWLDYTGVTYATGSVVTEEYWRTPDGQHMIQHFILEDPETYAHPIHNVQYFYRYDTPEDAVIDEYVCNLESARPELIMERYAVEASASE